VKGEGLRKILIFGNSGAGKSTLARKLCSSGALAHLDLDTLAWTGENPPRRRPLGESEMEIMDFINASNGWVIEGCYADLLELTLPYSNEAIFMNLPAEHCIENARRRPWEPHKYASKEAQDKNLDMLIGWIKAYSERTDTCSELAHRKLYEQYPRKKLMVTRRE
jgi:adenylate kinase family enzyme